MAEEKQIQIASDNFNSWVTCHRDSVLTNKVNNKQKKTTNKKHMKRQPINRRHKKYKKKNYKKAKKQKRKKQNSKAQTSRKTSFRDDYAVDAIEIISSPMNTEHPSIAASVYNALRTILNQKNVHKIIYTVLDFLTSKHSQQELQSFLLTSFDEQSNELPFGRSFNSLVPLGGCKLMASVIGCLCSPFNAERKQFHRLFNSQMQLSFFDPGRSNAKENLLLIEYEKAVKQLQCKDSLESAAAIGLSVSLTDLYAKKHPLQAGSNHDGHFAHCFNIVIANCNEAADEKQSAGVEMWVFSSFKSYNIKEWMNDHYESVPNPKQFIQTFNKIENSNIWNKEADDAWFKLFGVRLPRLVERKWPVRTYVRIVADTFTKKDLEFSSKLFLSDM